MKKNFRFLCISLSLLALTLFAAYALHSSGYRLNLSESLPGLVYRVTPIRENKAFQKGDRVLIDLSRFSNPTIELGIERGYVNQSRKMLKEIGAVPGDIVVLRNDMLSVNDAVIPMTVSSEDSRGEELVPYPTPLVLSTDHYWLISAPYRGFDSRYFGPVHESAFTHRASRVF
jgi:conjugative transfer signal peptidase TraF